MLMRSDMIRVGELQNFKVRVEWLKRERECVCVCLVYLMVCYVTNMCICCSENSRGNTTRYSM